MLAAKGLRSELRPVGRGNKQERLEKHLHFFVDRRIYVLNNQPWTVDFRNELVRFPIARYNDQVDALTLYLEFMFSDAPTRRLILSANSWEERMGAQSLRKGEHPMRPRGPGGADNRADGNAGKLCHFARWSAFIAALKFGGASFSFHSRAA
jgi:hypothetical protein